MKIIYKISNYGEAKPTAAEDIPQCVEAAGFERVQGHERPRSVGKHHHRAIELRKAVLDGIKRALFALPTEDGVLESSTLLVQGMGGSGKTVIASSIARDMAPSTSSTACGQTDSIASRKSAATTELPPSLIRFMISYG